MKKNWLKLSIAATGAVFSLVLFPKFASAATLFLTPGSGSYSVGSTITVNVESNTQGAAVNTAEANISYSTSTLELVSVKQGATFYLVSPGSPTKGTGTAYFGGGLPTPGYTGAAGVLGSMTFRAIAEGAATISIDSGHVLLNDGQGTDALAGTSGTKLTIAPPPVAGVVVTSATHPSPDAWYNKPDVDLSWNRPDGAYGFSFELDQNANTVPDNTLDTTVTTTKSYTALKDGVWYFHIKARAQNASAGFGATTNFKIQVDTEPPHLFDVSLVGETDLNDTSRTPTVSFDATDVTSGIDYYSVDVDGNNVSAKTASPYTFSTLDNGPHVIRVTAYDKAGNLRRSQLPIIVQGPAVLGFFQRNLSLPLYLILLINLLVLILLAVMIWLLFGRRRRNLDPVSDLQRDIDSTLEKLKHDIDKKLLSLTSKSSEDLLEKEIKIAKAVASDIGKTKRKIDSKIEKSNKRKKVD